MRHLARTSRWTVVVAGALVLDAVLVLPADAKHDRRPAFELCEDEDSAPGRGSCEDSALEDSNWDAEGSACEFSERSSFTDRAGRRGRRRAIMDCMAGYGSDGDPLLKGIDGAANLDQNISRAQYAVTLVRAAALAGRPGANRLAWANPSSPTFPDVPRSHVFYRQIETAVALGLFQGTSVADSDDLDGDGDVTETLFLPSAKITYAQIVKSDVNFLFSLGFEASGSDGAGSTGLDCRAFNTELRALEVLKILGAPTLRPTDCLRSATRGEAYDALAAMTNAEAAAGIITNPNAPVGGQTLQVLPGDSMALTDDDVAPGDDADRRQYTVSNPLGDELHQIVLFDADRVFLDEGGVYFRTADGLRETSGWADPGEVVSSIVEVNGVVADFGDGTTARAVNRDIVFVVDGDAGDSVIPVVFIDGDGNGSLTLDATGHPVAAEHFGHGGRLDMLPADPPVLESFRTGEQVVELHFTGVLSGARVDVHVGDDLGHDGMPMEPAYDPATFSTQVFTMGTYGPYSLDRLEARLTGLSPNTEYQLWFTQTVDGVTSELASAEVHTNAPGAPYVSFVYSDPGTSTNRVFVIFSEAVDVLDATGFIVVVSPDVRRRGVSASQVSNDGTVWVFLLDGTVAGDAEYPDGEVAAGMAKDLDGNPTAQYPPPT